MLKGSHNFHVNPFFEWQLALSHVQAVDKLVIILLLFLDNFLFALNLYHELVSIVNSFLHCLLSFNGRCVLKLIIHFDDLGHFKML